MSIAAAPPPHSGREPWGSLNHFAGSGWYQDACNSSIRCFTRLPAPTPRSSADPDHGSPFNWVGTGCADVNYVGVNRGYRKLLIRPKLKLFATSARMLIQKYTERICRKHLVVGIESTFAVSINLRPPIGYYSTHL